MHTSVSLPAHNEQPGRALAMCTLALRRSLGNAFNVLSHYVAVNSHKAQDRVARRRQRLRRRVLGRLSALSVKHSNAFDVLSHRAANQPEEMRA